MDSSCSLVDRASNWCWFLSGQESFWAVCRLCHRGLESLSSIRFDSIELMPLTLTLPRGVYADRMVKYRIV